MDLPVRRRLDGRSLQANGAAKTLHVPGYIGVPGDELEPGGASRR